MTQENKLFVHKYQPFIFDDYEKNNETVNMLKNFIEIDNLSILLIGENASGKTTILFREKTPKIHRKR